MSMRVSQVLITDNPIAQDDLSPPVLMAMQSVKDCFFDATHQLFQRPEIEDFIIRHFDSRRADLFKTCS